MATLSLLIVSDVFNHKRRLGLEATPVKNAFLKPILSLDMAYHFVTAAAGNFVRLIIYGVAAAMLIDKM